MLFPSDEWLGSRDHLKFWQKVAISKTLQDSDMVTMGDYQMVAFRIVTLLMTLSDFEPYFGN